MKAVKLLLLLALAIVIVNAGYPQDRKTAMKTDPWQAYIDWCVQKPDGTGYYYLDMSLVSNQHSTVATYITGLLEYKTKRAMPPDLGTTPIFQGEMTRYFSDRKWGTDGELIEDTGEYPFDPNEADTVQVTIFPKTNEVALTLRSEGNRSITFAGQWKNGVYHGFSSDTPQAGYMISVKKLYSPFQL